MWLLIRMTQLEVCKTEWSISLVRGVKTPQPRLLDIKANPVSALMLKLTAIVLLPKQNSHQEKGRQLIYLSRLFCLIPCHLDASKMSKHGLGLYNANN